MAATYDTGFFALGRLSRPALPKIGYPCGDALDPCCLGARCNQIAIPVRIRGYCREMGGNGTEKARSCRPSCATATATLSNIGKQAACVWYLSLGEVSRRVHCPSQEPMREGLTCGTSGHARTWKLLPYLRCHQGRRGVFGTKHAHSAWSSLGGTDDMSFIKPFRREGAKTNQGRGASGSIGDPTRCR